MKESIQSICIFCGSRSGLDKKYIKIAIEMGHLLAKNNIKLVYGGTTIGLMGQLADAALEHEGKVEGVIPQLLFPKEAPHPKITKLHITHSMHARKQKMYDLSDAFIALPGGLGTLDELFEILTWSQIKIHQKPIGMLNVDGYFDGIIQFLDTAVKQEFVKPSHRKLLIIGQTPEEIIKKIKRKKR
ncbi:MAG: TIGR00730 family Rossman fold protein [Deltaproteobacteria bacterium]|nr:TIGR00730 family Rossman fold protein [Deltaproteobacteria bacterium]